MSIRKAWGRKCGGCGNQVAIGRPCHNCKLQRMLSGLRFWILSLWGTGAEAIHGQLVIGKTKKGEPICLSGDGQHNVNGTIIRAMFDEAKALGLSTKKLHVYGTTCSVGGMSTMRFTQIDPKKQQLYLESMPVGDGR